jgi:SAM-dependent methyltransferase
LNINRLVGWNPEQWRLTLRGFPIFLKNYRKYRRLASTLTETFPVIKLTPYFFQDRWAPAGQAQGQYFHQDLLVAREIYRRNPRRHLDVGSRVDGFCAPVATFRPIEIVDIRPMPSEVPNMIYRQGDILSRELQNLGTTDSLSCLHTLEHIGLGRYGDPVDPLGHETAFRNLANLVEPGGIFYFSVPLGPSRVEFDAHRFFSYGYLRQLIDAFFDVEDFYYMNDQNALQHPPADVWRREKDNFGCRFGLAIFFLRKR